jgi:hypothetical protein
MALISHSSMSKDFLTIRCPYLDKSRAALRQLGTAAPKAVARGMRAWGETTRTAAIKVTPKKWGPLRNSIFVKMETAGERQRLIIGAGGNAAPYALIIHEKLGTSVNWSTPGTGPKYLENPIRELLPKLDDRVSVELQKEIKKAAS